MSDLNVKLNSLDHLNNKQNACDANRSYANLNEPIKDVVSFSGDGITKKSSGEFADKKFDVECRNKLTSRIISGKVDDLNFEIKHDGKLLKSDVLTGKIGDKDLNISVEGHLFKDYIRGTIGDEPVDLTINSTWNGRRIKGKFKNRDINILLNDRLNGYELKSDNMSLKIKSKNLFSSNVRVEGKYEEDPELIPILMDMMYSLNDELILAASAAV